jgi:hypothetical protein
MMPDDCKHNWIESDTADLPCVLCTKCGCVVYLNLSSLRIVLEGRDQFRLANAELVRERDSLKSSVTELRCIRTDLVTENNRLLDWQARASFRLSQARNATTQLVTTTDVVCWQSAVRALLQERPPDPEPEVGDAR